MTKFEEVYKYAIHKMKNYPLLDLVIDDRSKILKNYLLMSIVDFKYIEKTNINTYDLENENFTVTLNLEELMLLGTGITYYWVSQEVANSELLRDKIGRKDYNIFSPGNLLDKLITLKESLREEYFSKINGLSWNLEDIGKLKVVK